DPVRERSVGPAVLCATGGNGPFRSGVRNAARRPDGGCGCGVAARLSVLFCVRLCSRGAAPRSALLHDCVLRADDDADRTLAGTTCNQPGPISVPIRSAGQTRLTGALISASKGGLVPSGRSTM